MMERDVLAAAKHSGIIGLYHAFCDERRLYFVLEYAPNGELIDLLHAAGYTSFV